jgi:predicted kinase
LIAMVGAAGSGKSAAAKAFPADWRLELDALRAIAAGNCGDQSVNPVINNVFRELLDARLERRLSVVVDATNTKLDIRAHLLQRARTFGVPTVAILVRTDLETCLARQVDRGPDKRVPDHAVISQHALVPSREQLLADGWDQVHDAAGIDLLHLALQRAAAADSDPVHEIRVQFGDDLAAAFAYTDADCEHGRFTIAGRDLELRNLGGEPYDRTWQARIGGTCDCGGDLWVPVGTPAELLAAYRDEPDDEAVCGRCDDVLFVG